MHTWSVLQLCVPAVHSSMSDKDKSTERVWVECGDVGISSIFFDILFLKKPSFHSIFKTLLCNTVLLAMLKMINYFKCSESNFIDATVYHLLIDLTNTTFCHACLSSLCFVKKWNTGGVTKALLYSHPFIHPHTTILVSVNPSLRFFFLYFHWTYMHPLAYMVLFWVF